MILIIFSQQFYYVQVNSHLHGYAGIKPLLLAELSRAKRASGAPWVIKFGKLSIRENLVMT